MARLIYLHIVLNAVGGGWLGVHRADSIEIAWNEITSVCFAAIPRRFPLYRFFDDTGASGHEGASRALDRGQKGQIG